MKLFLAILALWLRLTSCSPQLQTQPIQPTAQSDDNMVWTHHAILDHEGKVHLYWTPAIHDITFQVEAETKGYIGIGFSPDGHMPNSDIVVGWVINNEPTLQDRWASGHTEPAIDVKQDYKLLQGYENDTHTVLRFIRAYDTCDNEDMKITNDTMRVIYAYNSNDPVGSSLQIHQMSGHRSLFLAGFNNVLQGLTMPDSKPFEMRMPNITLPIGEKVTCWEKIFKYVPSSPNEFIIGFEPLWKNTTDASIDHIWLYKCDAMPGDMASWDQAASEKGQKCTMSAVSTQYTNCTQIIATARAGSLGYTLPAKIGYSFESNAAIYFLMRIAYSDWPMKEELLDESGMAIVTSSSPVSFQADTLTVGHELGITQIIPIDQKSFITVGHCDSECTQTGLPADGIFIYEVFLKAQHHGRKMVLRHLRKGTELAPLAVDNKFQGSSQVYRAYLDPVHVMPGDNLVLECTYETTNAQSTVLGGLQGDNETCLAYLNYYPRVELKSCTSSPPLSQIFQWLGTKQAMSIEPTKHDEVVPNGQDPKLVEYLKNYNWVTRAPEFQNIVRESYTAICEYGMNNATISDIRSAPKVESPFYEFSKCESVGVIVENNNTKDQQQTDAPWPQGPGGHDHSGHDHGDHGPVGQDIDPNNPMMGDHAGHDHDGHDMGSMSTSNPNAIDGSTPMPGGQDQSAASQKKPNGSGTTQVSSSISILVLMMTALIILSGKH